MLMLSTVVATGKIDNTKQRLINTFSVNVVKVQQEYYKMTKLRDETLLSTDLRVLSLYLMTYFNKLATRTMLWCKVRVDLHIL